MPCLPRIKRRESSVLPRLSATQVANNPDAAMAHIKSDGVLRVVGVCARLIQSGQVLSLVGHDSYRPW